MTGLELIVIAVAAAVGFVIVRLLIRAGAESSSKAAAPPPPAPQVAPPAVRTRPSLPPVGVPPASLGPPLSPEFQQHLSKVIVDYGVDVFKDPSRLEGLLLDYCLGRHREDIRLVTLAARHNVPELLRQSKAGAVQLAESALQSKAGLDAARASRAVAAWVAALAPD